MLVEVGGLGVLGQAVEVGKEVGRFAAGVLGIALGLAEEVQAMNLGDLTRECFGATGGVELELPARGSQREAVVFPESRSWIRM